MGAIYAVFSRKCTLLTYLHKLYKGIYWKIQLMIIRTLSELISKNQNLSGFPEYSKHSDHFIS